MQTQDITLVTVIANLILTPIIQYMLHSRCSHIECCCMKCDREILHSKEEHDLENPKPNQL